MSPMTTPRDDDLGQQVRRALTARAALAPDADLVNHRVGVALGRRARRRCTAGSVRRRSASPG